MKKTQNKLQLKAVTLRMLQTGDLEQAIGGRATFMCTVVQTGCGIPQGVPGHPDAPGHTRGNRD
ncbi:MAG TPA: hypothetical protein VNO30_25700 [Kofleriaceae bacterium]|nr:hypothetical protein [Kofleriaceae bacterium]